MTKYFSKDMQTPSYHMKKFSTSLAVRKWVFYYKDACKLEKERKKKTSVGENVESRALPHCSRGMSSGTATAGGQLVFPTIPWGI